MGKTRLVMLRFRIRTLLIFAVPCAIIAALWSTRSNVVLTVGQNGAAPTDCVVYFQNTKEQLVAVAFGKRCSPEDLYNESSFLGMRFVSVNGIQIKNAQRSFVRVFFFDGRTWADRLVPRTSLNRYSSNKEFIYFDDPNLVVDKLFHTFGRNK